MMLLPGQSELVVAVEKHCPSSPALSIVLCPSSAGHACADGGQMCYWTTAGELFPPKPATPVPPVFALFTACSVRSSSAAELHLLFEVVLN